MEDTRGRCRHGRGPLCFQPWELHVLGDGEREQPPEPAAGQVSVCEGVAVYENSLEQLYIWPSASRHIKRTVRRPRYSDHELIPWFEYIAQGYCYKQSADKCLYPQEWILNTIYSDDEVGGHMLDLSMEAGALIRAGRLTPPTDRYDGLWDEYLP
jgi:hypothetical protein